MILLLQVNRLFVLPFEYNSHRTRDAGYFIPKLEIKDYNVMIDGQNFFDQLVNNDLRTYDNVQKITIGQSGEAKLQVGWPVISIIIDPCMSNFQKR